MNEQINSLNLPLPLEAPREKVSHEIQHAKNELNYQERLIRFLLHRILATMVWWLPLSLIAFTQSMIAGSFFLAFYISYLYRSWMKVLNPTAIKIQTSNLAIEIGYYLSTGLFLFLTGKYVYAGVMNNFVVHQESERFFVFLYAAGITLVLATVTYMIKSGKQWILLCAVYLLFDLLGALPFNFLHFYENQRIQSRLDLDKKLVEDIKIRVDAVIKPLFENSKQSASKIENMIQSKISLSEKQLELNNKNLSKMTKVLSALQNFSDDAIRQEAVANLSKNYSAGAISLKLEPIYFKELGSQKANAVKFATLIDKLNDVDMRLKNLKKIKSRSDQITEVESIKLILKDVCSSMGTPELMNLAESLVPNEPTQLESISLLYSYMGDKIHSLIKSFETALNSRSGTRYYSRFRNDGFFSFLNNDSSVDSEETRIKKIVVMSLVPSIIIDLLPLVFSIVYSRWRSEQPLYKI